MGNSQAGHAVASQNQFDVPLGYGEPRMWIHDSEVNV